ISVLKNSVNGEVEYAETHKPTTNQFGLFTLVIGQGTVATGNFSFISWAAGTKWLQIELDANGGSNYTLAGTQQMMTVPYAFYAEFSGNNSGITAGTGIAINNGVVSNTGDADKDPANELQTLAEVLTKSNNAGNLKITNLGAPIAATDAATKNYVDSQNALDLDQDPTNELQTLTQTLTRGNDAGTRQLKNIGAPTDNNDAATKNYVDTQNALDLDQDPTNELQTLAQTLTRGNDAGTRQLKNIGAPTDNNDAATKNYVDTKVASDLDQDPTNELQDLGQVLTKGTDAGGRKITNLGAPTAANDAATKSYVDTQNALDLDQSVTNEIQDLTLNTTTNILKITNNAAATNIDLSPYKQNLNQVLTNSNDAGTKTITNLGAPVTNTDATTKLYVDNAIATNYAFKVPYSFTNSGVSVTNQVVSFGADTYDDSNVTNSDRFVAPSSGYYMFFIDGTVTGSVNNIIFSIRVNSTTVYQAKKSEERIGSTIFTNHILNLMLKLSQNDFVELVITSNTVNDNVVGTLFGYKL
ncbi:MAG: hypothetical protein RI909_2404, partial [Bacteroidota bacterium]